MADIIDRSNDVAQVYLESSLTWKRKEGPEPTGHCLNCEAELHDERRWCDADCRDDWTKRHPVVDRTPEQMRRHLVIGDIPEGRADDAE